MALDKLFGKNEIRLRSSCSDFLVRALAFSLFVWNPFSNKLKGDYMAAAKGDTVKIQYTGRLTAGTIFDTSSDGSPLEFTLGSGMVISGFDEGVMGMEVGDNKTIEIAPENAYGEYNEDYVRDIPRGEINIGAEPQVGMELELRGPDGESMVILIKEVSETSITLDANHPLAGETLIFDLE